MSAPAAAAYLATLAELQGISHVRLDKLTGVGPRYLWRVQSGEIKKPAAQALMAIAHHVRAELRELQSLIMNTDTDISDGRILALASAVRRGLIEREDARILESATREELRAAIAYLSGLADHE